jgi:hypothetical protein
MVEDSNGMWGGDCDTAKKSGTPKQNRAIDINKQIGCIKGI